MPHGKIVDSQADDDEVKMRRRLGLDPASNAALVPSLTSDPLRGARQAIRSQAAAREYVERQLAHAEATNQDLRTKLHHARREKDAAVEAARAATARMGIAQRTLVATEAELSTEKAARERGERALRDAQTTIRDLQSRIDAVGHKLEETQAELAAERQARQNAEDALHLSITASKPIEQVAVIEQQQASPTPSETEEWEPRHPQDVAQVVTQVEAVDQPEKVLVEPVKRSVGRPRKTEEVSTATATTERLAVKKVGKPKQKVHRGTTDDQEPVQWWVPGWKNRRS
jgi:hypothetical protein